jgi:hypothetical protein
VAVLKFTERGSVSRSNVQTAKRSHFIASALCLAEWLRVTDPRSHVWQLSRDQFYE